MSRGRRYDVDALRVIAIGLLLVYHTAICFQPWGGMIGFLVAPRGWPEIWPAMTMLNVWRIPLLFFVSGMGLQMAMGRRTMPQLIKDRLKRLGIPLLFGYLFIVPLQHLLLLQYYHMPMNYLPGMAHLWFLGNIIVYALTLVVLTMIVPPATRQLLQRVVIRRTGAVGLLILIMVLLLAEVLVVNPNPFELFAFTGHGWVMGFIAFLGGFLLMAAGDLVWQVLRKSKWVFLAVALGLYIKRIYPPMMFTEVELLSLESTMWIFGLFGLAYAYLSKPVAFLARFKDAAYPVYILHILFQNLGSLLLFPLELPAPLSFILLLVFVVSCCLATYWFVVRRVKWMRWLFGMVK